MAAEEAAELRREAEAEAAERAWLFSTECASTLARITERLRRCAAGIPEADGTRSQPLRAGLEEDEGLRFAAATCAGAVDALSVQFKLPKWNRGTPYRAVLSPHARILLPPLVTTRNKLAQATAALAGDLSSLQAVHKALLRLMSLLPDILRAFSRRAPPPMPSNASLELSQLLQPPPPPELRLEASLCGNPAQLFLSAYLLRSTPNGAGAGGDPKAPASTPPGNPPAVAEVRHVAVGLESASGMLRDVEQALDDCRRLNLKIETFL